MTSTNTSADLASPANEDDYKEGSLSAPIVLVEYGDYQCPYCAQAVGVVQELQNELGEQLCYIFRYFPLVQMHPRAIAAARAAESAAAQGQFWQMHYELFSNQDNLGDDDLLSYAGNLDLDVDKFKQDLESKKTEQRIQTDIQTGDESGIQGTPAFFINGAYHRGSWMLDDMRAALKAIL